MEEVIIDYRMLEDDPAPVFFRIRIVHFRRTPPNNPNNVFTLFGEDDDPYEYLAAQIVSVGQNLASQVEKLCSSL